MFKMDMSKETEKKKLLPEGFRNFKIIGCEQSTSKKGNEMFIFNLEDEETQQKEEVYAITTQGKRWFLKQILSACGVAAAADGIYEWDIVDVLDKTVSGRVEHMDDSWINREGVQVNSKKHKIVEIESSTPF